MNVPPRYRRQSALEGGGMVPDPEGQWVHVKDLGVESWKLDMPELAPRGVVERKLAPLVEVPSDDGWAHYERLSEGLVDA